MKVYEGSSWVAAYASLSGALLSANNLSDVASVSTARTNIGLGTGDSPSFTGVSLSGGTVNGVTYLNGSKVLTSGSALTFDGSELDVAGAVVATQATLGDVNVIHAKKGDNVDFSRSPLITVENTTTTGSINHRAGLMFKAYNSSNSSTSAEIRWESGSGLATYLNNSEAMRLTSTGLGIGTSSPTNKLSVSGNANITGNTTLGDASTDTVQVNGYMAIGGSPYSGIAAYIRTSGLQQTSQVAIQSSITANSTATALYGLLVANSTEAASFNVGSVYGIRSNNVTLGAGSSATNQYGLYIPDLTSATNNYGITSLVSSGTNKWNIYASGTAANYFAGSVGLGTSTPQRQLHLRSSYPAIRFEDSDYGTGHYSEIDGNGGSGVLTLNADPTNATSNSGISLAVDGTERLFVGSTEAVFNNPGNDYDFRVESDTNTHAFFVDAGNSRVGINNSAPLATLDVGSASGSSIGLHVSSTNGNTRSIYSTTTTATTGTALTFTFNAVTSYSCAARITVSVYSGYGGVGTTTVQSFLVSFSQSTGNTIIYDVGPVEHLGSTGSYTIVSSSTGTNTLIFSFGSTLVSGTNTWTAVVDFIQNNANVPAITFA